MSDRAAQRKGLRLRNSSVGRAGGKRGLPTGADGNLSASAGQRGARRAFRAANLSVLTRLDMMSQPCLRAAAGAAASVGSVAARGPRQLAWAKSHAQGPAIDPRRG